MQWLLLAVLMGSRGWQWLRWWIRKKNNSHASFPIHMSHLANFTGPVVMIEGTHPSTRSSWKFRLLLRQQIEEHISLLKRKRTKPRPNLREKVFRWWNFIFWQTFDVYRFWCIFPETTHQNFKILLASEFSADDKG